MAEKLTCPRPVRGGACGGEIVDGVCQKCGCIVGVRKEQGDLPQPGGQLSPPSGTSPWGPSTKRVEKSRSRVGW